MTLSVVIPSLGGASLESTISALQAGTVVPDEILLCIPEREVQSVRTFPWTNVRVVPTSERGQVAQRARGFREARGSLVLQLDDDLQVASDCVALLMWALDQSGPNVAVSPALIDRATGLSVYHRPARAAWVEAVHARLIGGAAGIRPGKIHRSGAAVGVDSLREDADVMDDVDWLPGGCVLHRRENLVLDAFYPFGGKAFCEDIIHSYHLTSRGVRLRVVSAARCSVDVPHGTQPVSEFFRECRADLRARRFYMQLSGRRPALAWGFAAARWLGYVGERLR